MLKASALKPVNNPYDYFISYGLTSLIKGEQNIKIEWTENMSDVPTSIKELAVRMLEADNLLRSVITEIRKDYVERKREFFVSLADNTEEENQKVFNIFKEMYGAVAELHYCSTCRCLKGRLIYSTKAQQFLMGRYMEIAIAKKTEELLNRLSWKYKEDYKIYQNVKVTTADGKCLKNEFDLVIEFGTKTYVLEIKSGKNFHDFDKYTEVGRTYGIVPYRFLLISNSVTLNQASTICDYYVADLQDYEMKITRMIENDQR